MNIISYNKKNIVQYKNIILKNKKSYIDFIKNISLQCFKWIKKQKKIQKKSFYIICSESDQGVYGLYLSKLLLCNNYNTKIIIIKKIFKKINQNFNTLYKKLYKLYSKYITSLNINNKIIINNNSNDIIIIDSILGIDTKIKNINKNYFLTIKQLNNINCYKKISLDIPSGFPIYKIEKNKKIIAIKSDITLTFEFPKLSFLFPYSEVYTGKWIIVKTKLTKLNKYKIKKIYYFIDKNYIKKIYKYRKIFTHKGLYGSSLIIGGSYGMIGAILLTAKANLKTGNGKSIVYCPKCGYNIIQNSIPEAIVKVDNNFKYLESNLTKKFIIDNKINSIAIGPGLGYNKKTINFMNIFFDLIQKIVNIPLIIDADAIKIIGKNLNLLNKIRNEIIITPHPKELKYLIGAWKNEKQKIKLLQKISHEKNIYIILKGMYTIISCPNKKLFFNSTGNSGMSTAGSGDVLTGIISSLVSQNYSIKNSCILGVYLHGLSGDLYVKKYSKESLIATDLIKYISYAYKKIRSYY